MCGEFWRNRCGEIREGDWEEGAAHFAAHKKAEKDAIGRG